MTRQTKPILFTTCERPPNAFAFLLGCSSAILLGDVAFEIIWSTVRSSRSGSRPSARRWNYKDEADDIFLFEVRAKPLVRGLGGRNLGLSHKFRKSRLRDERVSMSVPPYNGQRGKVSPEADDIFLFQRLLSQQNYHINLGYLDYIACVGAGLHQHIMVRGSEAWQRDIVPLKLSTFSYFIDYFLNKMITYM